MFDIKECDSEMKATITAFSNDLKNIRIGRVSPEILKSIIVDSYGSKMPLTQLSNINNLDNMTLSINIWDASLTKIIEKNILESNLGATPQTDGNTILLKFPELTAERRKYIDTVKDLEKDKSISIDESKKNQDEVQKSTDNSISEIDKLAKQKENEILKV